ncbi:hypothetical protein NDU88_007453 [Pleurodeles waltl]|uniref:Uncharacterized protein n=1 Tax=Pleurodeles waltl TaxID=8319 RepID=A0AAV7LSX6_PLEWA|nr:hypothetical protein NDU88_007453 [Pleurodeles waltl]
MAAHRDESLPVPLPLRGPHTALVRFKGTVNAAAPPGTPRNAPLTCRSSIRFTNLVQPTKTLTAIANPKSTKIPKLHWHLSCWFDVAGSKKRPPTHFQVCTDHSVDVCCAVIVYGHMALAYGCRTVVYVVTVVAYGYPVVPMIVRLLPLVIQWLAMVVRWF